MVAFKRQAVRKRLSFCTVIFWTVCTISALAQSETRSESQPSIRRTFLPDDFARFVPRSALDMVEQIPGFTIRDNSGERGLGQVDTNVLINGRRVSGKSNGPVAALSRISAKDVVRLELVDGASLAMGGLSGQVLNLVANSVGGISGQFRYSPEFRDRGTPFRWGNGEISVSGGGASTEWTVSLENNQQRFNNRGPEFILDEGGDLIETRLEEFNEEVELPSLSGSFSHTSHAGNVLNLTGQVGTFIGRGREVSERAGETIGARTRLLNQSEDEISYELGADYEFGLAGGRIKVIGFRRFESSPIVESVRTDFANNNPPQGTVFTQDADDAETILRGEYTFGLLGGDWQLSLEGARNTLDIKATFEQRDALGALQPIPFPGSTAGVEEDRAEATLSHGRKLLPSLQLQTLIGAEYSQIAQSGELGLTRTFIRPKGFVSLDWDVTETLDVSFKLERVVGQLSFFDFIASVDVNQDRVDVTNANLVPQQSWLFDIEANQNLGKLGSATVRVFYEDISDIVDQIPIDGGGQAPGNINAAEEYGFSADLTLLSEPIGWPGGRLDLRFDYTDSGVIDPLLGTTRQLSGRDFINLEAEYRQDFSGTDWAVGAGVFYDEFTPSVRLDEVSLNQESVFGEIYVEHKSIFGLNVRATMGNLFSQKVDFSRTVFNERRVNDIAFREERFRTFGTIFTVDIQGSF